MVSLCDVSVPWLLPSGNDLGTTFVNNITALVFFWSNIFCLFQDLKKKKKDILIFITIKKNNIRIMRRFTTCFKIFSKSCCMYRAMRLQN